MQTLTSLSEELRIGGRCAAPEELEGRPDASPARTSSAEPLNATATGNSSIRSSGIGEGRLLKDPGHRDAIVSREKERVPVVSADGTPLMPCKPAKARKLLRDGKALKRWNRLGIFYVRLNFDPKKPAYQPIAIGIDPGSKFEGFSVVGTKDTVHNIMSEAVDWVKKALEQRRQMRRARRYRKTRSRKCRGDNRHSSAEGRVPPSTRARWDAKLRIIKQLQRILPISAAVVEDVKAETRRNHRRWNANFSPLEQGKQHFYSELRKSFQLITKEGWETEQLRKNYGLEKIEDKSRPIFESHCADAWALAASQTGAEHPTTRALYYLVPLRWHRRQLHRLQPARGGIRRREGGTVSLGLKRGTLVRHIRYGLCYIGGNMKERLSLHSFRTGRRLTQNAEREEFTILTRVAFRTQFLPPMKGVGILGGVR